MLRAYISHVDYVAVHAGRARARTRARARCGYCGSSQGAIEHVRHAGRGVDFFGSNRREAYPRPAIRELGREALITNSDYTRNDLVLVVVEIALFG